MKHAFVFALSLLALGCNPTATDCTQNSSGAGWCSCGTYQLAPETISGEACNAQSNGGSLCCLASDGFCSCDPTFCYQSSDGRECECWWNPYTREDRQADVRAGKGSFVSSCTAPSGERCCVDFLGICKCGSMCSSSASTVPSCNTSALTCAGTTEMRVTDCRAASARAAGLP